jgi:hypothetical protein
MNVGEWLAKLKLKHDPGEYIGIDGKPMVEIAPHCYLNRTAYEAFRKNDPGAYRRK